MNLAYIILKVTSDIRKHNICE